jgi:hypothetical protein
VKEEPEAVSGGKKRRVRGLAAMLGKIDETQAMSETNPLFNHGGSMNESTAMFELAIRYDLTEGAPILGKRAERERKILDAENARHILVSAVVVIGGREVPVIPPEVLGDSQISEFRKRYLSDYGEKSVTAYGVMKLRGRNADGPRYMISGTVDFGEVLDCGAGDGVDAIAVSTGSQIQYSLGRPPAEGQGTGSKQPREPKCIGTGCRSKLHGFRSERMVTRRMFVGTAETPGMTNIRFQLYAGQTDEKSTDRMHWTLWEDYFVPEFVVLSEDDWGTVDWHYTFYMVGICSLCGKSLEMSIPRDVIKETLSLYPEGVTDYEARWKAKKLIRVDEDDELYTLSATELLSVYIESKGTYGGASLETVFYHLGSGAHKEREMCIEAMNGLFGRARVGCGERHIGDGLRRETNVVPAWGRNFHVRAKCLIPVPCIEGIRDFIGADFEAATIHVWHMIHAGKVVIQLTSSHYVLLNAADVLMVTPCLIFWDPNKDGTSASHGQYNGSDNHVIDVNFLPETYEEYFERIGVKRPDVIPGADSDEPRSWADIVREQMFGSNGVPLTQSLLREMYRQKAKDRTEIRGEAASERLLSAAFYEDALPLSTADKRWWFGVQIRFDPTGPIMNGDMDTAKYLNEKTVVVCMDQLL